MTNKMARQNKVTANTLSDWLEYQVKAAQEGVSAPMSVHDIEEAWAPRFASAEIEELVIPRRTLARRRSAASKLTPDEADRAIRLARIQTEADRVFGDPERASGWLRTPNSSLSGRAPLQLLKTEAGTKVVSDMIIRIAHGIYA
jgi:putative toxin-antitoxin system antitoxin component (TIGR02293 family)